jgi:hypothetical protein
MPFPWAAVGMTVLNIGASLWQGSQQRDAASDANKLAEEQAEKQFERAEKEWAIDYASRSANYMLDVAKQEASKFVERQAKSDYEWQQAQLIDSALRNLAVNEEAIATKFGAEETLRATQEGMSLAYTQGKLGAETSNQLRQYMTRIRDNALQSKQLVEQSDTEAQDLQSDIVLGFQEEALKREIETVASVVGAATDKAKYVSRQGGSSSSRRQALNNIQALGRTYGLMENRNRQRTTKLATLNTKLKGERATELGRYALQMDDAIQGMKFSKRAYNRDSNYNLDVFRDLTMPSFELANRQGGRELDALYIQTEGKINEASMPFRESIWFDPIKPIAGLKPEYMAPTKVYEPSGLDIGLNALGAGINGAMSASYKKDGGGIGFF